MNKKREYLLLILLSLAALLAACGGKAYLYEPVEPGAFLAHAEKKSEGPVEISTAVPGREGTERIFGIDLYDQGIQPVWLQVHNSGDKLVRFAPVSTDPEYFSPLEVAYMNRRGYSDEARQAMNDRFHELAMPRYIEPGETRSGFVLTHLEPGAKGFNVDVFGGGKSYNFTFLLRVPGFEPDYARIDFKSLYTGAEIASYEGETLRDEIRNLPCCSGDSAGESNGEPINLVLVGEGEELVRALLRSGWRETSMQQASRLAPQYLYGREQDAIFRYETLGGDGFFELRFWKAPFQAGGDDVYAGQARHFFRWFGAVSRFDADVDSARNFSAQKIFYGQAIRAVAWLEGQEVVLATSFWDALVRTPYFTDGYRVVLWLSADPVSMFDIERIPWDDPPRWMQQ